MMYVPTKKTVMVSILLTHDMQHSENILEGESGRAVRKHLQGLLKEKDLYEINQILI